MDFQIISVQFLPQVWGGDMREYMDLSLLAHRFLL